MKSILEINRPDINRGNGVRELMKHPPFPGRIPVFIGDDVTDEAAFAALPELGGKGFSVGRNFVGLTGIFLSPGEVRSSLLRRAGRVLAIIA